MLVFPHPLTKAGLYSWSPKNGIPLRLQIAKISQAPVFHASMPFVEKPTFCHEKKNLRYFPWNTGWLIGILMSWLIIVPIYLGSKVIIPYITPTNQGPFFHCSTGVPTSLVHHSDSLGLNSFPKSASQSSINASTSFGCSLALPRRKKHVGVKRRQQKTKHRTY